MNKNLAGCESLLSPLMASPYLSPLPQCFRKQSDDLDQLLNFRLDHCPSPFSLPEEDPLPVREPTSTRVVEWEGEELVGEQAAGSSRVRTLIEFLVKHSRLSEELLEAEGRQLADGHPQLLTAFRILARKFRGLRKTKEELTKYCLRKAFKHRGDSPRADPSLKKHTVEKSMNAQFLRRIFSCPDFANDYAAFLAQFPRLATEDNGRKVAYLCGVVERAVERGEVGEVEKIKRLPWTAEIMRQVQELAFGLVEMGSEEPPVGRRGRAQ